ncbi:hypothetical protein KP509_06G053000 [Ceratopteris richardii]|nr:hypothetical protein KP509_06G053000 [Ceratopteris richardii]KAH7435165.1 hypothetical protein KP509_06G053000 [Ceratopteris richardii]KAH7435166.1 hypothetical protein KP509_06G053000 [Ceratopteris richardii]KAH7435167.1 hypothetical protein KP509_06G053000 [Ceratopteris richardii]KAH7435169.1 hypothetical protein KP509_06G053000 [Ceratopteris richardii]
MESVSDLSYNNKTNGYPTSFEFLSSRARLVNGKSVLKASALVAAWDDCTDCSESVVSNGSSGVLSPSTEAEIPDAEFADAGSHMFDLSPSTTNPNQLLLKVHVMEALISGIFSTVSSLKKAYASLQSAHVPLDAERLQLADKAVVTELKRLAALKQSYKERLLLVGSSMAKNNLLDSQEGNDNKQEQPLMSYEAVINSFYSEIQSKNALIDSLQNKLSQVTLKKNKLEKQAKRLEQKVTRESYVDHPVEDSLPSSHLLESAVLGASEASRTFAKLLISLMRIARWDLDAAANSIEPGISYSRMSHKKFVFESYIYQRMLNEFENGSKLSILPQSKEHCFEQFRELRGMNPHTALLSAGGNSFSKYCLGRFLDLVHPKMEESFFGNLDQRNEVMNGLHPQTQFYQNFLKLAKAMWLLHLIAFSFEPHARIFQVKRNTEFSPLYMESLVRIPKSDFGNADVEVPRVGFTVMPGFRVGNTVIKCQVYVLPASSGKP